MLPSSVFLLPVSSKLNVPHDLIDPQPSPSGYHHERNLSRPCNQKQQDVGIDVRPEMLQEKLIDLNIEQEALGFPVDWGQLKLIPDSLEDDIFDSNDKVLVVEQSGSIEVLHDELTVTQDEEVPKVDLPVFSSRHLSTFEGVFLSEEQVRKCEAMFAKGVKSSNPSLLRRWH